MMFNWSVSFLSRLGASPEWGYAGLVVASLNMLLQLFFDFIFGEKSFPKLGGWFK